MTQQFDETMPSPPRSPSPSSSSPEHIQLERINAAVDATLAEFTSLQQRVISLLVHVIGLRWYQAACHTKLSYTRWKDMTKQASQLTYACAGTDEALMRHLFSLDAIMGDDDIRILRRTCVHRIKHAITQVEQYTTYMYKVQYWIKKWIQHGEEQQETTTQMDTETQETTSSQPASPSVSSHPTPQSPPTRPFMSPPVRSSRLQPPVAKTRSNSLPGHHPNIKTSRSITSSPVLKPKKAPSLTKSPSKTPTTSTPNSPHLKSQKLASKSPVKSPALTPKAASPVASKSPTLASTKPVSPLISPVTPKSAPASPKLPHRHIPTQPPKPTPPSSPRFSVSHDSSHITITAHLPGVVRDSLDVTVRGHILRIVGICQGERFVREMELPETCDVDEMDAAWEEQTDTLKIRVPIVQKQNKSIQQQQQQQSRSQQPPSSRSQAPSRPSSRHMEYDDMEDDGADDMDVSHPYYSQPMGYPYRCAPSYVRPSYHHPAYARRPVHAAPPRSMFGASPFGGFW